MEWVIFSIFAIAMIALGIWIHPKDVPFKG